MLKGLGKASAYVRAPRKTFMLLHPWKTVKLGAAFVVGLWLFSGLLKKESEG